MEAGLAASGPSVGVAEEDGLDPGFRGDEVEEGAVVEQADAGRAWVVVDEEEGRAIAVSIQVASEPGELAAEAPGVTLTLSSESSTTNRCPTASNTPTCFSSTLVSAPITPWMASRKLARSSWLPRARWSGMPAFRSGPSSEEGRVVARPAVLQGEVAVDEGRLGRTGLGEDVGDHDPEILGGRLLQGLLPGVGRDVGVGEEGEPGAFRRGGGRRPDGSHRGAQRGIRGETSSPRSADERASSRPNYPARIRTWKNRTKTCCDTVSPPGNVGSPTPRILSSARAVEKAGGGAGKPPWVLSTL